MEPSLLIGHSPMYMSANSPWNIEASHLNQMHCRQEIDNVKGARFISHATLIGVAIACFCLGICDL